jgi:hypothetical protein
MFSFYGLSSGGFGLGILNLSYKIWDLILDFGLGFGLVF